MSLDIYVRWFRDGAAEGVPEGRVRTIFGDALEAQDELGWRISYGHGLDSQVYLSLRDSKIEGLTVNRPAEAPELWQALFDLLGVQNGVFFFPGSRLFVRSAAVAAHVPLEMVEALGSPEVVSSAEALRQTLSPASS